ncbi:aminoglycoside phosphotransferase [Devosia yakushimensis]|uniref:Aminoglycoside phosphotransferase n=1 Tax=Devosia yakushimensis TaxID=470028 RepID=A0ABQ5U9E0_9HYPH|nr:aminoglycoside phosphotransferase family protein [Devosia yakushimensis]GLQ08330.1 aminoglycoside phosphotransferase [Devosia yakushimensis]
MRPGRLIGRGKEAEVFEAGEDVLKLYRAGVGQPVVEREAGILARLADLPLPAPQLRGVVEIDGRWGLVMSRAVGQPLAADLRDDTIEAIAQGTAMLHGRIHAQPGTGLESYKARLTAAIGQAEGLEAVEQAGLMQRLAALPDGDRLCHGDFHPANIIGSLEHPVIVDWPDARSGPPAADVGRSYLLLLHNLPAMAEPYLAGYEQHWGLPRAAVLDWLPVLAAARLAENVPAEAERLLALARSGL